MCMLYVNNSELLTYSTRLDDTQSMREVCPSNDLLNARHDYTMKIILTEACLLLL